MGTSRFFRPEAVTIPISNGDTITIRKTLNTGEERALFDRARIPGSDPPRADKMKLAWEMLLAYLLDWSFLDEDGAPVAIRGLAPDELASMINLLPSVTTNELTNAIAAHITALATEKKTPSGEIAP